MASAAADDTAAPSKSPSAASKVFSVFLEGLAPCLGAVVQGIDVGPDSDLIRLEITRRADLAECGCVFPEQPWLPVDFMDANGELIHGVDLSVPGGVNQPSVQTFDLYHSKFDGYAKPYVIEIRCETAIPPG